MIVFVCNCAFAIMMLLLFDDDVDDDDARFAQSFAAQQSNGSKTDAIGCDNDDGTYVKTNKNTFFFFLKSTQTNLLIANINANGINVANCNLIDF